MVGVAATKRRAPRYKYHIRQKEEYIYFIFLRIECDVIELRCTRDNLRLLHNNKMINKRNLLTYLFVYLCCDVEIRIIIDGLCA